MTTDFVIMRGKNRLLKASREGAALTIGFDPHDETTTYPDEAAAVAALQAFVKKSRRQGFITNDEHHAKEEAAEEDDALFEPDRRRLLRDGESFGPDANLEVRELGNVAITSGKVAARDPFVDGAGKAFARRVPKGDHLVTASLLSIAGKGRAKPAVRCAAATIHFAKGAVASLVPAGNYGVDAGTASFMDVKTIARIDEAVRTRIVTAMKKTRSSGFGFAALEDPSVIAFTSGLGDGAYASYWGFSRAKKLLLLMTDFALLDRARWELPARTR